FLFHKSVSLRYLHSFPTRRSSDLSVFEIQEAYTNLKANQSFLDLQNELTETENKVAYSRQLYNSTVASYNIKRESFPSNIIASIFNFKKKELLAIPEAEREVPNVEF